MRYRRAYGTASEDQRNCRSDGWQYGLVSQQLVCASDYAMRRSRWMHVQGLSSAISHAPRTLQMSHVPNKDDLLALLWQILSGTGFPNQFFCDSWVVGFWRGRPWLAGCRIGETSLNVGSCRF